MLDCFRVLGRVPFDRLVGLMQQAAAFIRSFAVRRMEYQCRRGKVHGKQIVLSDIPVHREQAPERGFFFPADDSEALVKSMMAEYNGFDEQNDGALQDVASARFPERQCQFGEAYLQIILRVSKH